jgi:superfamily II DNA or RNA helicase
MMAGAMNNEYAAFLASKAIRAKERGMHDVPALAAHLFPFQHHCVDFNLRAGSSGLFLDTGLGKTEIQLEWSQKVIEAENRPALILTPLAVARQFKRRADRWGYEARVIKEQSDVKPGINICNYDRLDKLDPAQFCGVALDEASILKSFSGKTTRKLIDLFKGLRFKLAATATPAPNDHMELGNYAEFLDVMATNEMLSRFFINDTSTASQEWRLKGHAATAFYDWMASWSRMAEKPSDLGDKDEGFILPPFQVFRHRARDSHISRDLADMFGAPALSATNVYAVKRQTSEARAELAASIVASEPDKIWLIWVDTDNEGDAMLRALPNAIEVRGSQSADEKEAKLEAFSSGTIRQFISKPSLSGFGMDWSHCARMVFVGRTYSYETWYQAVRRCWRFGQKETVVIHLVVAEGESEIGRVIDRKAGDHIGMKSAMRAAMNRSVGKTSTVKSPYEPLHQARIAPWISDV